MGMLRFLPAAALVATLTAAAAAQTVYQPPRIQYGRYNEIIYGGLNPVFTSNDYGYLPEALQSTYRARRQSASVFPYPAPFQLYGPNTRFYSPYFLPSVGIDYPSNRTMVFSDLFPYEEVGHLGYTINDAHNEAYARVPRVQSNLRPFTALNTAGAKPTQAEPTPGSEHPQGSHPRAKAIPLLDWAKREHSRNPALYKALIQEAAKYDPAATEALSRQLNP